jgi:hypothetical protein
MANGYVYAKALAEQNFISKAPKARGLKIITTDSMSVEGRWVSASGIRV